MFDITKLKNGSVEYLNINEEVNLRKEDLKGTSIERLENIKATGKVTRLDTTTYQVELVITGNMVLLCARSLEEVDFPLNMVVQKTVTEEKTEEKPLILQNSLDIFSIIWENIVLEVPLRVIKEDANFISSGDGWDLRTEDNPKFKDTPFSELNKLLDMEGKEWN